MREGRSYSRPRRRLADGTRAAGSGASAGRDCTCAWVSSVYQRRGAPTTSSTSGSFPDVTRRGRSEPTCRRPPRPSPSSSRQALGGADDATRGAARRAAAGGIRARTAQAARAASAPSAAPVPRRAWRRCPGEDVVVLHVAGGPALVLHPETARELMLAQSDAKQTRGATAASVAADGVEVPANLRWGGLDRAATTRGWLGNVILSAVEVVTGLAKDPAADLVAAGCRQARRRAGRRRRVPARCRDACRRSRAARRSRPGARRRHGPPWCCCTGPSPTPAAPSRKLWTQHPGRVRELFDATTAGRASTASIIRRSASARSRTR